VAGVDEAGRGPLAGPVVAAAVILPEGFDPAGLDDSKRLSPAARAVQAARIEAEAVWAVGVVCSEEIDASDILRATLKAMCRAVEGLGVRPVSVLIDGLQTPTGLAWPARAQPGADAAYACVAAASILAKTLRDSMMREAAREFPEYGFDRHFGYPTPEHLLALQVHGPCRIHRFSFAPVRRACCAYEALRSTALPLLMRETSRGGGSSHSRLDRGFGFLCLGTPRAEAYPCE
jgi:ribonuclease HII